MAASGYTDVYYVMSYFDRGTGGWIKGTSIHFSHEAATNFIENEVEAAEDIDVPDNVVAIKWKLYRIEVLSEYCQLVFDLKGMIHSIFFVNPRNNEEYVEEHREFLHEEVLEK